MYCSSCGKAVTPGLIYCNYCGFRLSGAKESGHNTMSEASFNFLIAALLGIPIAGIGLIIGVMSVMKKELGMDNSVIAAVVMFCFFLLLTAEIGFMRLLLHRTARPKEKGEKAEKARPEEVTTRSLNEAQPFDNVQPAGSVTENTTRSFEPVYREPKAQ